MKEAEKEFGIILMQAAVKTAESAAGNGNVKEILDLSSGSTWTYQIDDNPFPSFRLSLLGMGTGAAAASALILSFFSPLLFFRKFREKLGR